MELLWHIIHVRNAPSSRECRVCTSLISSVAMNLSRAQSSDRLEMDFSVYIVSTMKLVCI